MKKKLLILSLLLGGAGLCAQTIVQQSTILSQGSAGLSLIELEKPTGKGNILIAMSTVLSPGISVVSVTDDGGNVYKKIEGASASCANKLVDIWYCEKCKAGVTEVKFNMSQPSMIVNSFLEVSDLAASSPVDGSAHVSDGTATGVGQEVGGSIRTTAKDFILALYFPTAPRPTGVTPSAWTFNPSYVFVKSAAPGTYQPTLTGAKPSGPFCMGMAAFKTAGGSEAK
jgi:hypothetical protein